MVGQAAAVLLRHVQMGLRSEGVHCRQKRTVEGIPVVPLRARAAELRRTRVSVGMDRDRGAAARSQATSLAPPTPGPRRSISLLLFRFLFFSRFSLARSHACLRSRVCPPPSFPSSLHRVTASLPALASTSFFVRLRLLSTDAPPPPALLCQRLRTSHGQSNGCADIGWQLLNLACVLPLMLAAWIGVSRMFDSLHEADDVTAGEPRYLLLLQLAC